MTKEKIIEIIKNELECVRTASDNKCDRDCENCKLVRDSDDIIKAYDFVIEMLEQEPCEDAISRQAVLTLAKDECDTAIIPYKRFVKGVNSLPPVTPQEPKTGHWIKIHPLQADDEGAYMCSCCKIGDWDLKGTEKLCPSCGAKMVEPQESEGKE